MFEQLGLQLDVHDRHLVTLSQVMHKSPPHASKVSEGGRMRPHWSLHFRRPTGRCKDEKQLSVRTQLFPCSEVALGNQISAPAMKTNGHSLLWQELHVYDSTCIGHG